MKNVKNVKKREERNFGPHLISPSCILSHHPLWCVCVCAHDLTLLKSSSEFIINKTIQHEQEIKGTFEVVHHIPRSVRPERVCTVSLGICICEGHANLLNNTQNPGVRLNRMPTVSTYKGFTFIRPYCFYFVCEIYKVSGIIHRNVSKTFYKYILLQLEYNRCKRISTSCRKGSEDLQKSHTRRR